MRKRIACLLFLAILVSACGKAAPVGRAGSQSTATPSPGASLVASLTPSPGKSASPAAGATSSAQPVAKRSPLATSVPGVKSPPIEASLESECGIRGGVQAFTIKTTPGFKISWGTAYNDGGTHASTGTAVIPATGLLRVPWTIAADVPLGYARTDIAVVGEVNKETQGAYRHLEWNVASTC